MGKRLSDSKAFKSHEALKHFVENNGNTSRKNVVVHYADGTEEYFDNLSITIEESNYNRDLLDANIFWEDAGLSQKEFNRKGLYGVYSSSYCKIQEKILK